MAGGQVFEDVVTQNAVDGDDDKLKTTAGLQSFGRQMLGGGAINSLESSSQGRLVTPTSFFEATAASFNLSRRGTSLTWLTKMSTARDVEQLALRLGEQKLEVEELIASYPDLPPGTFEFPITKSTADLIAERKRDDLKLQDAIARGPQNIAAQSVYFAAGIVPHIADPIDLAADFATGMVLTKFLAPFRVGKALGYGTDFARLSTGRKVLRSSTEGFVGGVATEPIHAFGMASQGEDYRAIDNLAVLAAGALGFSSLRIGVPAGMNLARQLSDLTDTQRVHMFKHMVGTALDGKIPQMTKSMEIFNPERTRVVNPNYKYTKGVDSSRSLFVVADRKGIALDDNNMVKYGDNRVGVKATDDAFFANNNAAMKAVEGADGVILELRPKETARMLDLDRTLDPVEDAQLVDAVARISGESKSKITSKELSDIVNNLSPEKQQELAMAMRELKVDATFNNGLKDSDNVSGLPHNSVNILNREAFDFVNTTRPDKEMAANLEAQDARILEHELNKETSDLSRAPNDIEFKESIKPYEALVSEQDVAHIKKQIEDGLNDADIIDPEVGNAVRREQMLIETKHDVARRLSVCDLGE